MKMMCVNLKKRRANRRTYHISIDEVLISRICYHMTDRDEKFRTHIKEPRWQQVVSVIVALGLLGAWLWVILHK